MAGYGSSSLIEMQNANGKIRKFRSPKKAKIGSEWHFTNIKITKYDVCVIYECSIRYARTVHAIFRYMSYEASHMCSGSRGWGGWRYKETVVRYNSIYLHIHCHHMRYAKRQVEGDPCQCRTDNARCSGNTLLKCDYHIGFLAMENRLACVDCKL